MDDSRINKYGQSSDEIPEPPPPTRQYFEPQEPAPFPPLPPAMGYPPAIGYPPGYRNGYDQQHYQQGPPPSPDMYYAPPHCPRQDPGPPSSFAILTTMMLFVFFTFIFGLVIMFLIARPKFPIFHVETLAVTNFSVANDDFTSAWEINLVVENRNFGANVHFDRIQSFIYFNTDDLLASSHFDYPTKDVTVKANEKGTIDIKLSTADYKQSVPAPGKRVMEEMRNIRETGVVPFSLRAFAWSQIEMGLFYTETKHIQSRIICEDLKVHFEGDTGNGKLNGKSKDCVVDL